MATNFFRVNVDDRAFIRGAGRLLVAPISQPFPQKISDVISLSGTPTTAADDVQTLSPGATAPTGGTFTLEDSNSNITAPLDWDSAATDIQTAVEALPSIGSGNIVAGGGPLGTDPVTLTGAGELSDTFIPLFTVNSEGLTPENATYSNVHTTPGTAALSLYDAQPGWGDLGATKNGITITVNNTEDTFTIDQQLSIVGSQPSGWTVTVGTSLAESTPERMQVAWEGSDITIDNTPTSGPEQQIGFGAPNYYIQRRMAVLFQRPSGLIRGYFFRIAQRSPQESALVHASTGDQQSIPVLFNVLADNTIEDVLEQFFIIRDQSIPTALNP